MTTRQVTFEGSDLQYNRWLKEPVEGDIFGITGVPEDPEKMRNFSDKIPSLGP